MGRMNLKISSNHRFLVHDDNAQTPWFYLADTGWTILQRLNRKEVLEYLDDRKRKGFTATQVMGISEFNALRVGNFEGEVPLIDMNPETPNPKYWDWVEWVIDEANQRGIVVCLLPSWGDKVVLGWGVGPVVFTPENAHTYAQWLGRRFRDKDLIWVVGGDRTPRDSLHFAIWRAMAAGLTEGDGGRHLKTFHPNGPFSSSHFFHGDDWLDFNMLQSSHGRDTQHIAEWIERDYNLLPVKPCLDGEACYEDHPIGGKPENGYFDDHDVRRAAYQAVFAGAHGHTYGANGLFQCFRHDMTDNPFGARLDWRAAMQLPGSSQMQHLKNLMLSRPYLCRVPDQAAIVNPPGSGREEVRATGCVHGSYLMLYVPEAQQVVPDASLLAHSRVRAHWFDPRTGQAQEIGEWKTRAARGYRPPVQDGARDWVLVLDDATRDFPPPGSVPCWDEVGL